MFPKENRGFAFGIPCEAMLNASSVVKTSTKGIIFRFGSVSMIYRKMKKYFPEGKLQKMSAAQANCNRL
jgi:hypothetical protein